VYAVLTTQSLPRSRSDQ